MGLSCDCLVLRLSFVTLSCLVLSNPTLNPISDPEPKPAIQTITLHLILNPNPVCTWTLKAKYGDNPALQTVSVLFDEGSGDKKSGFSLGFGFGFGLGLGLGFGLGLGLGQGRG